jgi:large subunit ribosomal protein L15
MPLFRRLPKRGFKTIHKKNIAILNLSDLALFIKNKKIKLQDEINIKNLLEKKLIRKKYDKLKILGKGEVKEKLKVTTDFISKSARSKIEKAGGSINISKQKIS